MSGEQLVKAQAMRAYWKERILKDGDGTHYDGCELGHKLCAILTCYRAIDELMGERDEARKAFDDTRADFYQAKLNLEQAEKERDEWKRLHDHQRQLACDPNTRQQVNEQAIKERDQARAEVAAMRGRDRVSHPFTMRMIAVRISHATGCSEARATKAADDIAEFLRPHDKEKPPGERAAGEAK